VIAVQMHIAHAGARLVVEHLQGGGRVRGGRRLGVAEQREELGGMLSRSDAG